MEPVAILSQVAQSNFNSMHRPGDITDEHGNRHPIRPPGMPAFMPLGSHSRLQAAASAAIHSPSVSPACATAPTVRSLSSSRSRSPIVVRRPPPASPTRSPSRPMDWSPVILSPSSYSAGSVVTTVDASPTPSIRRSCPPSPCTPHADLPDFVCPHCYSIRAGTVVLNPRGIEYCVFTAS